MLDASRFAYNSDAPFELTVLSGRVKDGESIQDISFNSPLRNNVSAYLIGPPEPQPPGRPDLWTWGEGNREEFVEETVVLARLRIASFCLYASFRRPAEYEPEEELPLADLQWVVDVRRAVDILGMCLHPQRPCQNQGPYCFYLAPFPMTTDDYTGVWSRARGRT